MPTIATLAPLPLIRLDSATLQTMMPLGEKLPKWAEKFIEAHNRTVDALNAVSLNAAKTVAVVNTVVQEITVIQNDAPTVDSLGVEFGTFGSRLFNNRVWGMCGKLAANSNAFFSWGMTAPSELPSGGSAITPTVASPRGWTRYTSGLVLNNVAGLRQIAGQFAWVMRPRLKTLMQNSTSGAAGARRVWIALTSAAIDQVSTDATKRYVGLRYDPAVGTTWYLCTADGTTASELDTGVVATFDVEFAVDLDFSDSSLVTCRINDTPFVKTTHLPSGTGLGLWQVTATLLAAGVGVGCALLHHHTLIQHN